jgi:hypothetical protein
LATRRRFGPSRNWHSHNNQPFEVVRQVPPSCPSSEALTNDKPTTNAEESSSPLLPPKPVTSVKNRWQQAISESMNAAAEKLKKDGIFGKLSTTHPCQDGTRRNHVSAAMSTTVVFKGLIQQ